VIDQACDQVNQYCLLEPDLCPCNRTSFFQLPGKTVREIDESTFPPKIVNHTVAECPKQCINSNFRNLTQEVLTGIYVFGVIGEALEEVQILIVGFTGPVIKAELNVVICEVEPITNPLWAGCALLLLATSLLGITLLAIDRGLCCFKDMY